MGAQHVPPLGDRLSETLDRDRIGRFEAAHRAVASLVHSFARGKAHYVGSGAYQEAEVRTDFIDKFFMALGWDVSHQHQRNPYRQEVKIEKSTKDSGKADYAFAVAPYYGRIRFLVEAKRPQVSILSENNCFQTIRYGWPLGVPICVLTDFNSLHILDTRFRPNIDSAISRVIKSWPCTDLLDKDKFGEVYWLLSRQAVADNSIERFAEEILPAEQAAARQYSLFPAERRNFDDDFLDKLDEWRERLAKVFKRTRSDLDGRQLTELVQRTLDRLIFIRFLEDKQIEQQSIISQFGQKGKSHWQDFVSATKRMDQIYNGIIFKTHFILDEKHFQPSGTAFADICDELTDEHSPYNFASIPVEILGRIYERFLGKEVLSTRKDSIKVAEKYSVRKAGGVYYTPDYIVRYMVQQSLGELIQGKNVADILKLRIIDTSCGSGSFLISAFEYLMQTLLTAYRPAQNNRYRKRLVEERDGELHLTMDHKREILLKCIYGVDIDPQAVEVAQLSLYLKLMEDETTYSARHQQLEMGVALLPSLSANVVVGNSLVTLTPSDDLFSIEHLAEIKSLDFRAVFSDVFKSGGFDLLIGNPPYIKEYVNREAFDLVRSSPYYQGKMDIWYLFACRGIDWLRPKTGILAFIATNNWVTNAGASLLREKLARETTLVQLVDFGDFKVFRDAGIQTMIIILRKDEANSKYQFDYRHLVGRKNTLLEAQSLLEKADEERFEYLSPVINRVAYQSGAILTFSRSIVEELLNKVSDRRNFSFDAKKEIAQGIVAPQDFVNAQAQTHLEGAHKVGDGIFCLSDGEKRSLRLKSSEEELLKPYYTTRELGRFFGTNANKHWIIYTGSEFKSKRSMDPYPNLKRHLDQFKSVITSHNAPYGLHRARVESFFLGEKIVALRKCDEPTFTFTDFPCYVSQTFNVIKTQRADQLYLTGLLNSRLIRFWLRHKGKMQGNNFQIDNEPLANLPIFLPSQTEQTKISSLVRQIIQAYKKLGDVGSQAEQEQLLQLIRLWEGRLNEEVEIFYGLTDEDRKLLVA